MYSPLLACSTIKSFSMYCDPCECHSQNIQLGSEPLYLFLEAFYSFALVRWWKMNKTQSVTVIQIKRGKKKSEHQELVSNYNRGTE